MNVTHFGKYVKKTCLEEVITKAIRNKILWKFKKHFLADKSSYE